MPCLGGRGLWQMVVITIHDVNLIDGRPIEREVAYGGAAELTSVGVQGVPINRRSSRHTTTNVRAA
jgi:hypothetical protein